MIKNEARVIGIDDSPFDKFKDSEVLVVGVVMRGGSAIDGILSTKVDIDGNNSTEKLVSMINGCKFKVQIQYVFLDGIALGGFNVIDVMELHAKTNLPIIVTIRKSPDMKRIKNTLTKINKKEKIAMIERAGKVIKINSIYCQLIGLGTDEAMEILKIVCTRSLIPEPVRLAHLIASGIILGESRGRA